MMQNGGYTQKQPEFYHYYFISAASPLKQTVENGHAVCTELGFIA